MHLKRITLKGFKSFPDRTRLDFAPGVSVIVGPNGSGKSNITDGVLWALGEQSPLAVRGQTMQDVIFAGGHGVHSRHAAEVEVVLDNPEGALAGGFSEIAISRRLERDGEGEYRLNGARCRLVDVLEVLSDTGLGREMHSVVSQGRVEAIVHSKPRDRRLLIEEAAGLGKHRKRRRRAQLKLERTEDNVARVLDVEREARSRLRPLKRQAEAAELHERLRRQWLEARLELLQDACAAALRDLAEAEEAVAASRAARGELEEKLRSVSERRERAEQAFAAHSTAREALSARLFAARSAAERIGARLERAEHLGRRASELAARLRQERDALRSDESADPEDSTAASRVRALEEELERVEARLEEQGGQALASLKAERESAARQLEELDSVLDARRRELVEAEEAAEHARAARIAADRAAEAAAERAATARAELLAAKRFVAAAGGARPGSSSVRSELSVEPGLELAVAAVLGPLGGAALTTSVPEAARVLDAAREEGGSALVVRGVKAERPPPRPPVRGARPLLDCVDPSPRLGLALERVLHDAWLVSTLEGLPERFSGVAVTREGRALFARTGELRQAPAGGEERLLAEQGRRERLAATAAEADRDEASNREAAAAARSSAVSAIERRDRAEGALRSAQRERDEAAEAERRAAWLIERGGGGEAGGPDAVRRAELIAELRAERHLVEESDRARRERARRIASLASRAAAQSDLASMAERAATAMRAALAAVETRRDAANQELQADQQRGESTAAELRACAREEAEIQAGLRDAGETVTTAEVRAQQARDGAAELTGERDEVAGALGLDPVEMAPAERLDDERRAELEARVDRLARRREQLGPVNPLAAREYEEAVAHVEDLETQRSDLESAIAELRGLIRETDRRIREAFDETFDAAARSFEDVVSHLFPGGRGRLRLVQPDGPRPVLGGEAEPEDDEAPDGAGEDAVPVAEDEETAPAPDDPGVEIEVTPAGKSTKRLSLMSGGEKSLVALAFLFAVFLARPCPFYILDEVEAALDDANIDRFLELLRRYCDRAQFIVVTHQRRTMDAADCLYGVSMGGDGISKVVSRRLTQHDPDGRERRFEPAEAAGADQDEVQAA